MGPVVKRGASEMYIFNNVHRCDGSVASTFCNHPVRKRTSHVTAVDNMSGNQRLSLTKPLFVNLYTPLLSMPISFKHKTIFLNSSLNLNYTETFFKQEKCPNKVHILCHVAILLL
jgi:hypothetical protein